MIRQNRFNLSTGVVELNFPMPMTPDDVQDFEDAMAILFRMLRRTATNEQRQVGEATREGTIQQLVPDSNSASGFRLASSLRQGER